MQEALLVHLVEQAGIARPGRDSSQELLALLPRSDIADLNDNKRVFALRPSGKDTICVQLSRSPFDAIAEMFEEGRCSCAVEATGNNYYQHEKTRHWKQAY